MMFKSSVRLLSGQARFLSSTACRPKKRVALIGSGNWGTVVAKMVGGNLCKGVEGFEAAMMMYVRDEKVGGRDLCDIINVTRVNQRYMPHCTVPLNVTASSDLQAVAASADLLILVFPHQFVETVCAEMKGTLKLGARAVSLIKGVECRGGLKLVSEVVRTRLDIDCHVLMGANIASEVAQQMFSEATIGCRDAEYGQVLKSLFETAYFRISVVADASTVELCGALKNIVAVGAGLADGLGCGRNTYSAVIRLGLIEMIALTRHFYHDCNVSTFFESCGIGDLVTTAVAGRNHLVAMEFAKKSKQSGVRVSMADLEESMLNGQKLQGPATAADVATLLLHRGLQDRYPLFMAIHHICSGQRDVASLLDCLHNHPQHNHPQHNHPQHNQPQHHPPSSSSPPSSSPPSSSSYS